jgi:prepilin-type N-terminal cleavage/methylation domain-containing protein
MNLSSAKPAGKQAKKSRMYMRGYSNSSGFTLTELLIVIGIIVLFVTMALPAFNLISGGKSIAGAENELSAMLGRARMEAIGIQDYRGLAIYRDPATDRYAGAMVTFVAYSTYPASGPTPVYPEYSYVSYTAAGSPTHYYVAQMDVPGNATWVAPATSPSPAPWAECPGPAQGTMDIEPDTDSLAFPAGVGVQVLNDFSISPATGNKLGSVYLPMGVILFGPNGGLAPPHYVALATYGHLGTLAHFFVYPSAATSNQYGIPAYTSPPPALTGQTVISSSFGLVAFDKQSFDTQNFYNGLPLPLTTAGATYGTTTGPQYLNSPEANADTWLNTNSTPLLINRYNGTLIRAE